MKKSAAEQYSFDLGDPETPADKMDQLRAAREQRAKQGDPGFYDLR